VPHFGVLVGAGREVTILDAEGTDRVLKTSGYEITVSDLTVTGGAGAVYHNEGGGIGASINSGGSLTIERCVIRENINGYGLQTFDSGKIQLTDCEFTGNIGPSNNHGAAMRFGFGVSEITMTNCLVANNSAYPGYDRSGVYFDLGYNTLINCTIVDNYDIGLYAIGVSSNARLRLYNCIIWGHEDDIHISGDMPVEIYHCNISDGDGVGENGNISQDPLFVTGAHGDYYLSHSGVNCRDRASVVPHRAECDRNLPLR